MNDDTISALGGFCTELLSNEAFTALCQLYSQQCAVDILATLPHEAKAREGIYASYQGFEGFLALTKKFADAAEKQATQHQPVAVTTHDDLIDDPGVHDIYGNKPN
jgi:hypothetical protein